jgi:hypothetical protein
MEGRREKGGRERKGKNGREERERDRKRERISSFTPFNQTSFSSNFEEERVNSFSCLSFSVLHKRRNAC